MPQGVSTFAGMLQAQWWSMQLGGWGCCKPTPATPARAGAEPQKISNFRLPEALKQTLEEAKMLAWPNKNLVKIPWHKISFLLQSRNSLTTTVYQHFCEYKRYKHIIAPE